MSFAGMSVLPTDGGITPSGNSGILACETVREKSFYIKNISQRNIENLPNSPIFALVFRKCAAKTLDVNRLNISLDWRTASGVA